MISPVFIIIAVAVACDSAPVISQADSKGIQHLLDGLRGLELWRRELIDYAQETTKDDNADLLQILQFLSEGDSYMIELRKYFESIVTFLQSDENSLDAKEVVANLKKQWVKIFQLQISLRDRAGVMKKFIDVRKLPTEPLDLLRNALQATEDEVHLIVAELQGKNENSPSKSVKDIINYEMQVARQYSMSSS